MPSLAITARPQVLVPEKLSPDGLVILSRALDVHERKGLSQADLLQIIHQYDALVIRSETKVTADVLAAGKRLKVVARAGVGVDNVDVEAATKLGIVVVNSPSGNIGAAAEHTIALMMSMARNIPDACASLKGGKWERSRFVGIELKGKTMGIIGLGKVGLIVARIAKGLGMKVISFDPYASPAVAAAASVMLVTSLAELLPAIDFLTIHTPLIASTKGMISTNELAQMKPGSRILNVARGGTIDELALLKAVESGHITGAALDVFTSEPPSSSTEPETTLAKLIAHPNVVVTPHLGASTKEAQESVSIDVCEQVLAILAGSLPRSAVNAPLILPEEYKTLQPFVQLVEKMGSLYTQHFSSAKLSHQRRQERRSRTSFDLIYEGEVAAINNTKPLFAALIKGLLAPIATQGGNVNIVNAELVAKERGISVTEQHSRDYADRTYSSLITLVARSASTSRSSSMAREQQTKPEPAEAQHVICGYVSGGQPYISRLSQFSANFVPEGSLLICHNYDSPGKIGVVGSVLGKEGVNINFMSVAPASFASEGASINQVGGSEDKASASSATDGTQVAETAEKTTEALMILGVDKEVGTEVEEALIQGGGVLSVSSVTL